MAEKVIHEVRFIETDDGFRIEVKGDKERMRQMGFGPGMMGFGPRMRHHRRHGQGPGCGPGFGFWRHFGPWWEEDEEPEGEPEPGGEPPAK